ncbi:TPA: restriction endonuclease subunit S [Serratia marcescens]|nr:restriction endonuclease subunit S [Serratia marcescens]
MNGKLLPETWLAKLAIDCFDQISTTNSKVKSKDCSPEGLYPVIDQGQNYISGYINDESKVIKVDSPICIFGDHTRIVKWVTHDFVPGADGTKLLQPKAFIHPRYAYYSLRTLNIPDKGYSRHFKYFKELEINLPGRLEQKIIAEKIDTLLAQVDSTKARLEQIPQILKRFRQVVLSAAVSGRLTKVWREKNQDSSSSGEWQQFALSELGVLSRGKSKHRPRNDPRLFGDTYPFIQTGEVANSSGRIKSATKFYSEFGLSQSKLFPQGTLCITIAANIADTAILDIDACFPDSVVGFIPKKNKSHVLFIKYLIDANKEDLEAYAPATAQKNINLKVLNDLRFPMPGIEEQLEIVRRVEQLFAYADTIEKQVNSALTRVNSLTQSILAKAFRGELTAQWRAENPDLISGENSAAALLEKIKAERAASGGKKASRKKA